jgi:hypothetical protein
MKKTLHNDYEKVIRFSVWSNYDVHIIFTDDIVKSRMGRYGTAGAAGSGQTGAMHSTTQDGHSHLFYKPTASAEIITHEAFHAIWCMFNWAGVQDWDNETTAYHLGWLVGHITKFQSKVVNEVLGVKSSTKKR